MKIVFTDLPTSGGKIQVSLDGGFTFTDYEIADGKKSGIPLDSSQAFDKIKIKGSANVLKNLDVVSSINTLYESELLPEDITGIVLKNFNGQFDKSLLQKYPNLKNLSIPDGVTSIGKQAFVSCTSLASITIPESVTSIDEGVFSGCSKITSIVIPDSVTSIGDVAFQDCSSLTSIVIPNSVTSIGNGAFYACSNLKTINYKGTKEQWNALSKGNYWNSRCPSDMAINYNYQG